MLHQDNQKCTEVFLFFYWPTSFRNGPYFPVIWVSVAPMDPKQSANFDLIFTTEIGVYHVSYGGDIAFQLTLLQLMIQVFLQEM